MPEQWEINRAITILNEAKKHDIISDVLPEDDETKIKLANHVVKQARRAYELNERGPHVTAILYTANVDWANDSKPDSEDEGQPLEKKFKELVVENLERGLSIPPELEEEVEFPPIDLTQLSDKQLQFYHGAFSALLSRTTYLLAIDEASESAAKFLADELENEYLAGLSKEDRKDVGGKPKTAALLKAEASKAEPAIIKWRERQQKHHNEANTKRRLLDIYENKVEVLSRQGTLRQQEREKGKV